MALGPATRVSARQAAWVAAAAYGLLALALTWPLGPGLARDVPGDLVDPLLNCWIVGWGADHVTRFAAGDWNAFGGFWSANIFHPAPLTLTYSEHLFAQAVQAAPIYAATHDLILCYNLLFLSTFVLCGLGLFLLLRDLTGDSVAAFAGGVVLAFAPYRFEQVAHLQLLSFQWVPFALLGLRRFVHGGRWWPLALATLALIAHALSCGYYLLFFAPFFAAYVLYELTASGRLARPRQWIGLALCAGATTAATLPFLLPYVRARELAQTTRSALTVRQFSADLAAWVTATPASRLWGPLLPGFDRAEGHLFPGLTPLLLASIAIVGATRACWRSRVGRRPALRLWAAILAAMAFAGLVVHHAPPLGSGPPLLEGLGLVVMPVQVVLFALAAGLAILLLSGDVRRLARRAALSLTGFCTAACLVGVWLSLGTEPRLRGFELGLPSLYSPFYEYVPGFDGLRAPTRYAAVVVVFLSLLAGLGLARLRRWRRGTLSAALLGLCFLLETVCVPLPLNRAWDSVGLRAPAPPGRLPEPAVYSAVRRLPRDAVLLELPMGEMLWETRAMYYSTRHWRRLVNGYSGYFPRSYIDVRAALRDVLRDPDEAWRAIRAAGTTHVLVHGWVWYRERIGQRIEGALVARGAMPVFRHEEDVLLALPPPGPIH